MNFLSSVLGSIRGEIGLWSVDPNTKSYFDLTRHGFVASLIVLMALMFGASALGTILLSATRPEIAISNTSALAINFGGWVVSYLIFVAVVRYFLEGQPEKDAALKFLTIGNWNTVYVAIFGTLVLVAIFVVYLVTDALSLPVFTFIGVASLTTLYAMLPIIMFFRIVGLLTDFSASKALVFGLAIAILPVLPSVVGSMILLNLAASGRGALG